MDRLCRWATIWLVLAGFAAAGSSVLAQNEVIVTTQVVPPHSPYLADYVGIDNKVLITLVNTTQSVQQMRLTARIQGGSVSIVLPPTFIPAQPITLGPGQSRVLTGKQLTEYLNPDNLQFSGISKAEVVRGNGLPEGDYQICVQALNFQSGNALSLPAPRGCATFRISHFEPPILQQPVCSTSVKSTNPQNVLFSWTIPAGVQPQKVEYVLRIVEIIPPATDPNQAMLAATNPPFFEKVTASPSFLYGPTAPKLEVGKKYAWRVTARNKGLSKELLFKNNGHSLACFFTYTKAGIQLNNTLGDKKIVNNPNNQNDDDDDQNNQDDDNQNEPPQNLPVGCLDNTTAAPGNSSFNNNVSMQTKVKVGFFSMDLLQLVPNGSSYTGKGKIKVDFLKTQVNVTFANIKINTNNEMYEGTVTADVKPGAPGFLNDNLTKVKDGVINGLTAQNFEELDTYVESGLRKVSKFTDAQINDLPFALDKSLCNINVVGLIFTPTKAYMNVLLSMDIPEAVANEYLSFSTKGIEIQPKGLGINGGKLSLSQNIDIPLSTHSTLRFKANKTFVNFDCGGFSKLNVGGELEFSRERMLPVSGQNVVDGKVKATFESQSNSFGDWIVNATMVPTKFTTPATKGFIFSAANVKFDKSSSQNPPNLTLHPNHPKVGPNNKDWQGLFIGEISIQLPESFKKGDAAPTIKVNNLTIDKSGFWAKMQATKLIHLSNDNGDLGGWRFSIDTLALDIQASDLAGGKLAGEIILPIASKGLKYSALLQKGNDGVEYQFSVKTVGDLEANLWVAKLSLLESSSITIGKVNGKVQASALLNGAITIAFDKKPEGEGSLSKLSFNGIKFEQLSIAPPAQPGGMPKIDLKFADLGTQGIQHAMAKFPIQLTKLSYVGGNNPGIQFGVKLNLSKGTNGFEAATQLTIRAKWEDKKFAFKGIQLDSLGISANLGFLSLNGGIRLYNEDPTYGTGFRGDIAVTLKVIQGSISATVQFGKIGDKQDDTENNSNYRYWFVDIMAKWGTGGIPIPGIPAAAFYGFGGGAFKNMTRELPKVVQIGGFEDKKTAGMTAGATRSGVVMTPKKGTFGFSAAVAFGSAGEPTAFNGDLKLMVTFNSEDFGLKQINLDGDAYLMSPMNDRSKKLLKASAKIVVNTEKPLFDMQIDIEAGFDAKLVDVSVKTSLGIHFDPDVWYVKLGYWTNDDEPWKDNARTQIAINVKDILKVNFFCYFMMGNDIGPLPRSPLKVRQALKLNDDPSPKSNQASVKTGKGFAFGAGFRIKADFEFILFYANLEMIMGFDVTLAKYEGITCNGQSTFGLNNWYAKGNAYAYLDVDAGIMLNLWVWKGKFSLLKIKAAAQITAELPNPSWLRGNFALKGEVLGGLIKINTKFKFEVGKKCVWGDSDDFGDLPIIAEMLPEDKNGSVFECPQVGFNYVLNTDTKLTDDNGKTRRIKVMYEDVKLKGGGSEMTGKVNLNVAKNGLTFIPDQPLKAKTSYTFSIKGVGYVRDGNSWKEVKTEPKSVSFTTGDLPDKIDAQNMESSYPFVGQRYFLAGDQPQGKIKLIVSQCYLFNKPSQNGFDFSYVARFTNTETGNKVDAPCTCDGVYMSYNMPNLGGRTVYKMQIVEVGKPSKNANVDTKYNTKKEYKYLNSLGQTVVSDKAPVDDDKGGNKGINQLKANNPAPKGLNNQIKAGPNTGDPMLVVENTKVKNEQKAEKNVEKELFAYYFRTSKYKKASEKYGTGYKLANGKVGSYFCTYKIGGSNYEVMAPTPVLSSDENMDIYDAYGYTIEGKNITVPPLGDFDIEQNNWIKGATWEDGIYGWTWSGKDIDFTSAYYLLGPQRHAESNVMGVSGREYGRPPLWEAIRVHKNPPYPKLNITGNQVVFKPDGKLSNAEINTAKAGNKLEFDKNKQYVTIVVYYLEWVMGLDFAMLRKYVCDRCDEETWWNWTYNNCVEDHWSNKVNVAKHLMPKGKYPFSVKYGYESDRPFKKTFTFDWDRN